MNTNVYWPPPLLCIGHTRYGYETNGPINETFAGAGKRKAAKYKAIQ